MDVLPGLVSLRIDKRMLDWPHPDTEHVVDLVAMVAGRPRTDVMCPAA